MTARAKITGLFRRKPLTEEALRARREAELAKHHLSSLKAASRSLTSGSQQIDASRPDADF
jgi:hypothetical protein